MSRRPLIPLSWTNNNSRIEKPSAATTLTVVPSDITLSENKCNFKFEPKDAPIPYVKAGGFMIFGGYIPPGETITIICPNITSVTLTAAVNPGANEFYTEATAPTNILDYLEIVTESVADALYNNLSVSNNYSIAITGFSVRIDSNFFGVQYNFTTFTSSISNISFYLETGTNRYVTNDFIDYAGFANIFICNQVYGSLIQKFDGVYAGSIILNTNNEEVNIDAGIVGNYVEHILPVRNLTPFDGYAALDKGVTSTGAIVPGKVDTYGVERNICVPFFIEYGDKFSYAKNKAKKQFTRGVTEIKWMQLGAFDQLLPYDMNDYVWNPVSNKTFKWLTSCPIKTVTYDSHEYLQVINQWTSDNRSAFIELVLNFYDGTQLTVNKTPFSYQDLGGNVSFDVSPTALDLKTIESVEGKLIDSYSIRLNWDINGINTGVSSFKTYKFDRNCYNDKENIIFVNEFGGWDSLEFRGSVSESLERSVDSLERALPFNANSNESVTNEVRININTDVTSEYVLNSGLLSPEITGWSKKLMESSAVYIWDNEYNNYRAILITDNDYVDDDSQTGRSLTITYTYTTDNNSISR